MDKEWYQINSIEKYDTPFMAVYPARIRKNIELALQLVNGEVSRFRPHIKTHKMGDVLQLFLEYGITKIKCATIAEAELAAANGIPDVMLAYQPAGPKLQRLIQLIRQYPDTLFSCLVDNLQSAGELSLAAVQAGIQLTVYIDLNTGMNRTGYPYREQLPEFYQQVAALQGLTLAGLHIYDGHLHHPEVDVRMKPAAEALTNIQEYSKVIVAAGLPEPVVVAGGSNTFFFYAGHPEVECSPGTFVFWDINYTRALPELWFQPAAVLVMTVISKPSANRLCLDLGYKSVSSENPIDKRVIFPWNPDLVPDGHSEEHLTVQVNGGHDYTVGHVIYGIPYHVCPSAALYDEVQVVENHEVTAQWPVLARKKKISV